MAALAPALAGCAGHPHATGTGTAGLPRYYVVLVHNPYSGIPPQMRTLDASGGGGSLAQSRLVVTLSPPQTGAMEGTIISPDGGTITVVEVYSPNSHPEANPPAPPPDEIVQFPAATGAPAKVLFSERRSGLGGQITSDGNGHLAVRVQDGLDWVGGGRLHGLNFGGNQSTLTGFAW